MKRLSSFCRRTIVILMLILSTSPILIAQTHFVFDGGNTVTERGERVAPVLESAVAGNQQVMLNWTPAAVQKERPVHFNFEGGNAADPIYTIYFFGATLNGMNLEAGDEIAVFDDSTMVGALILDTICSFENYNNDLAAFATLNSGQGYVPGDTIKFKCWDASAGIESSEFQAAFMDNGEAWTQNVFPEGDDFYSLCLISFFTPVPYQPTYNVYYSDSTLVASGISDTTFVDSGLTNGIEYCYFITQIMPDGLESEASNVLCATPFQLIIPVTGISVLPDTLSLMIGENGQLTPSIEPPDATNQNITWASANQNIATVDESGFISALAEGLVYITATTDDGNFSDSSLVIVNQVIVAPILESAIPGCEKNMLNWSSANTGKDQMFNSDSFLWKLIPGFEYIPTYNLYYGDGTLVIAGLTDTSFVDQGLVTGTEYCYYVTQILPDSSESVASNILCATPEMILPEAAGTITGTPNVCEGQTNVQYSVPVIENADGYSWILPDGAAIVSGNNTNLILVDYSDDALSGNVAVTGTNACGIGFASPDFSVTVSSMPGIAGNISGLSTVCQGQNAVIYSVPVIENTVGYIWTLPTGASIVSGYNTHTITVNFPNTATSGNITVYGYNNCGMGTISPSFALTVNPVSGAAGIISGSSIVCQGQNGVVFSIAEIPNATGYVWTVSAGATIVSGENANSITVNFSTTAVSGNFTVYGTNNCGNGAASPPHLVFVNPLPGVAGLISGNSTVCQGQNGVIYSIPAVANATGYVWTIPAGATIVSGANTNTVILNFSDTALSGEISVYGTNTCGNGTVSPSYPITVNPLPLIPGTPAGPDSVCYNHTPSTDYVTTGANNATSYLWTITPAAAGVISGNGLTATVLWNIWAGNASISVRGSNDFCEGPLSESLNVYVDNCQGISEKTVAIFSVSVYPNPSNGLFTIELNSDKNIIAGLSIRNLMGKTLWTEKNIRLNGRILKTLDLNNLMNGVYFVYLECNEGLVIKKITILH